MTVLWDGTSSKPWGRMLFAEQSVMVECPTPIVKVYGDTMKRIRLEKSQFQDRWFTAEEFCQAYRLTSDEAASAIGSLRRSGDLRRERIQVGHPMTTMARQRYQWVQK